MIITVDLTFTYVVKIPAMYTCIVITQKLTLVGKFTSAPHWMRRLIIWTLPNSLAPYNGGSSPYRCRNCGVLHYLQECWSYPCGSLEIYDTACLHYNSAVPYWPLLHEPVEDPLIHHVHFWRQSREVCPPADIKDINSTRSIHQPLPPTTWTNAQRQSHVALIWAHCLHMYMHQWPIHCDDHADIQNPTLL